MQDLKLRSVDDLIGSFERAALDWGEAATRFDHEEANRHSDVTHGLLIELGQRGRSALEQLLPLLEHDSPYVRQVAAVAVLAFAPERGLPIIEKQAHEKGVLAIFAMIGLERWRKGEMQFSWLKGLENDESGA